MLMESQVAYEQDGAPSSSPSSARFEISSPGARGPGVSVAQWIRSACSLQVHRERLLQSPRQSPRQLPRHHPVAKDGECEEDDWQRLERLKRRFVICVVVIVTGMVLMVAVSIVAGLNLPWGKPAYNQGLVDILEKYAKGNITISSTCLYKQHNNGAWFSDKRFSGMVGRQRDGKGGSPDILYYHHQGNLLELSDLYNNTRWMQVSMNRGGVGFRVLNVPQVIDVIRYTKECYFWCGSLTRHKGDPARFATFLRNHREPYNGFTLNCLQFSKRIWQYFDAENQGCAPAHLVNEEQFVQQPFPKFDDDPENVIGPPV